MSFDVPHTIRRCSFVLSVHFAIYRADSVIAASVNWISLLDSHAVTHVHFGNNNLTYRQKTPAFQLLN